MKESWYGDKRDLLKWSAVLQLCKQHEVDVVFHIAMLTHSAAHEFEIDGNRFPVVDPVWKHFRSLRNVERLFGSPKLHIFEQGFTHAKRRSYFDDALEELKLLTGRKLVLIDPDTGLAPKSASEKHVRADECQAIWENLASGDLLLLYQHQWRENQWRQRVVAKMREALNFSHVIRVEAPGFASDVILVGAVKSLRAACE
ncbi:MAG: hypothetical protein ABMA13_00660 [Chthoniobacteraceae bacterium]